MCRKFICVLIFFVFTSLPHTAFARVIDLDVQERRILLNGQEFGDYGAYELLSGTVTFGLDPALSRNRIITDLELAPTNIQGLVLATAEFLIMQPVDPQKRTGIGWLEVSNRGRKTSLLYFNKVSREIVNDPEADFSEAEEFGNGFMMRQGFTLMWVGWQYDVPFSPELLNIEMPVAEGVQGLARSDWVVDEKTEQLNLGHLGLPTWYAAVDYDSVLNVLSRRTARNGPRQIIPGNEWHFTPDGKAITRPGGFSPGIYELVYLAEDPVIAGIGLAAVRDLASYAKFNPDSPFPVDFIITFGVSQTGRYLRHFLEQGFTVDEEERKAVDGLLIHTAGAGKGSFNHRFSQPAGMPGGLIRFSILRIFIPGPQPGRRIP